MLEWRQAILATQVSVEEVEAGKYIFRGMNNQQQLKLEQISKFLQVWNLREKQYQVEVGLEID